MECDRKTLIQMYRTMLRIRRFEEIVGELFGQGRIWGGVHLYTGEEAMAAGACAALNSDDYITSTHRGHGHCIAKGGELGKMMAELFGRANGYCKGKGGSMHIADLEAGILGANGIVGAGIPIAVGAALAAKYKGTGQVSAAFFSDGASNTGSFHEAVNLAAVLRLPVVFVCENNQWAVSTAASYSVPVENIAERAVAYGIPGLTVDGNDVLAVYGAVREAVDRARHGDGPSLVEGKTYRWEGHYRGDPEQYRSKEEVTEWRNKGDPIPRFRMYLLEQGVLNEEQMHAMETAAEEDVAEAVRFAESSPKPEPDGLYEDLYA
jgi:pyruvate dehydrogenase E1 component alpha subunit